jgi:hypothetical protein
MIECSKCHHEFGYDLPNGLCDSCRQIDEAHAAHLTNPGDCANCKRLEKELKKAQDDNDRMEANEIEAVAENKRLREALHAIILNIPEGTRYAKAEPIYDIANAALSEAPNDPKA